MFPPSPKIAQGEPVESAHQVSVSSVVASGPECGMARRSGSSTLSFHHDALVAMTLLPARSPHLSPLHARFPLIHRVIAAT